MVVVVTGLGVIAVVGVEDGSPVGVGGGGDGTCGGWDREGGDGLMVMVAVDTEVAVVVVVVVAGAVEDTARAVVAEVLVTQTLSKREKQKT